MKDEERRALLERLAALELQAQELQRQVRSLQAELRSSEPHRAPAASPAPQPPLDAAAPMRAAPRTTARPPGVSPRARAAADAAAPRPARETVDWELWLGGRGLLLLGVVALVLAVGFFLKYSIDRGWIGPGVRVALGAAVGIAAVGAGDRLRAAGYRTYGLWLAAGGFGAVYLSVWASAALYSLVPAGFAFLLMVGSVAGAALIGIVHGSQAFVMLAAFGGYLAPVLLATETPSALFGLGYLAVLSGAGLWTAHRERWLALAALATTGGLLMALVVGDAGHLPHGFYLAALVAAAGCLARLERWPSLSLLSAMLAWLVFALGHGQWNMDELRLAGHAGLLWLGCVLPYLGEPGRSASAERRREWGTMAGAIVAALPPWLFLLFFHDGVSRSALRDSADTLACALGVALGLFYVLSPRSPATASVLAGRAWLSALGYSFLLHAPTLLWSGIALARVWITEGLGFGALAAARRSSSLRAASGAALALTVLVHVTTAGRPPSDPAFYGSWALTWLALPAALAVWSWLGRWVEAPAGMESAARKMALVVAGLLFLGWGTIEIERFYELLGGGGRWDLARDLTISGFYVAYAAALLLFGTLLGKTAIRRAGLGAALLASGKVFLYDLANLAQLYRIASFVLLAVVLLVISFGYQKLRVER